MDTMEALSQEAGEIVYLIFDLKLKTLIMDSFAEK